MSSSESDVAPPPPPPPPPPVRINRYLTWERVVTPNMINNSGVLHFPNHIGRRIPRRSKMNLLVAGTSRRYSCSLRTATRSSAEKSLSGEGWGWFLVAERVKVGDVLKFIMGGRPMCAVVQIIRV